MWSIEELEETSELNENVKNLLTFEFGVGILITPRRWGKACKRRNSLIVIYENAHGSWAFLSSGQDSILARRNVL
jgi:hypothetical protein